MPASHVIRAGSLSVILALSLVVAGCASEGETDRGSSTNSSTDRAGTDAAGLVGAALEGPDGKDERVLGSSDDDVLAVVEQTLSSQNAKARWDGNRLRVELDGSVDDATATTPCLMMEAFLKDGEEAVLGYGDGDVRCSER